MLLFSMYTNLMNNRVVSAEIVSSVKKNTLKLGRADLIGLD